MGGGTAEFVTSEQRLPRIIVRLLRYAIQPVLENVEVVWNFPGGGCNGQDGYHKDRWHKGCFNKVSNI